MSNYRINIMLIDSMDYTIESNTKDEAIEMALSKFMENEDFFSSIHISAEVIDDENSTSKELKNN